MSQEEIDRAEWEDRDNWSGPDWAAAYFSKKDSRTWVPKKLSWMGWTLNLGRDSGVCWLLGFVGGLPLLFILVALVLTLIFC